MALRTAFGDVELMLVGDGTDPGFLEQFGTCVTSTPPNLKELLADGSFVLRVARAGGGESDNKSSDEPRVNVQVYALRSSQAPRAAHVQAAAVRTAMLNLPAVTAWGRLDTARTDSGPIEFPWPDPEIQVVQQVFRLSTRP